MAHQVENPSQTVIPVNDILYIFRVYTHTHTPILWNTRICVQNVCIIISRVSKPAVVQATWCESVWIGRRHWRAVFRGLYKHRCDVYIYIYINIHAGCIVLYNIPPTPVHVPRRFVIFCCTWTPPRHTPSPAAALNTKYRRAHPNVRPGRRRRSRYYILWYYYCTGCSVYCTMCCPGTMDVICTRKQKPGEISPGRVYISPENDNNNNNTPARSIMWLLCAVYRYTYIILLSLYYVMYAARQRGRGPLARRPTPYSPATRFSVALNAVGENVLTVYGICILHAAAAVGKTFISYNIL